MHAVVPADGRRPRPVQGPGILDVQLPLFTNIFHSEDPGTHRHPVVPTRVSGFSIVAHELDLHAVACQIALRSGRVALSSDDLLPGSDTPARRKHARHPHACFATHLDAIFFEQRFGGNMRRRLDRCARASGIRKRKSARRRDRIVPVDTQAPAGDGSRSARDWRRTLPGCRRRRCAGPPIRRRRARRWRTSPR